MKVLNTLYLNLENLENMNNILEWFSSNWWSSIDGIVTIGTLIIVLYNAIQNKKQLQNELEKIPILFDVNGTKYLLDLDIPRKYISRSEIQGVLAAFQVDIKGRYSLNYLSDLSFLDDIFKIQQNTLSSLTIKLDEKEFFQFNISKMKQQ